MNINLNPDLFRNGLKNKRAKFGIGSSLITLTVGFVFVVVGTLFLSGSKIDENWIKINGQIIDTKTNRSNDSTTYSAVVSYEVDGQ